MPIANLIFAGQGALAESAEMDRQAWNATFRAAGLRWDWSWDTYAELMRPGGSRQLVERYAEFRGLDVDVDALRQAHARAFAARMLEGLPLRRGVAQVFAWAAKRGIGLALVSRGRPVQVHALLTGTARARAGIEFDVVLSSEDTERLAPYPDGILQAMEAMGAAPQTTLAISDTPAGAAAALDAGLTTLATPGLLAEELSFPYGVHEANSVSPELLEALSGPATQAAE